MLFWALVTVITICVAAFLLAALRIPAPSHEEQDQDLQFYKAQLDEVERDVARPIMPQEAQQLHAEIARRLLKSAKFKMWVKQRREKSLGSCCCGFDSFSSLRGEFGRIWNAWHAGLG